MDTDTIVVAYKKVYKPNAISLLMILKKGQKIIGFMLTIAVAGSLCLLEMKWKITTLNPYGYLLNLKKENDEKEQ